MSVSEIAELSLEQAIQRAGGNPARMLRSLPAAHYTMPFVPEYTTWRDEQRAWRETAVLYDQSNFMTDLYVKGPDVKRVFADLGVNGFANFGRNKAKQFVACSEEGNLIADAILFGLADDEYVLVGTPVAPNWVQYNVERGNYDVEVVRDEPKEGELDSRRTFRYQLNGPATLQIVEAAHGRSVPHIPFFTMDDFEIAGTPVRALNHTMSGVPGREMTGLELVGPREGGVAVLEALLAGGERFGLRRGGALSYVSTVFESGWIPSPVPAIYTGDTMRPYREWLGAFGLEGFASIGGSFASENIEDYYVTPWDIGYGHVIKFDHEFVGRAALERLADRPHRRKVWLRWNKRDVADTMVANLSGDDRSPKSVDLPVANFTHFQFDEVRLGERPIGLSTFSGYTVNVGQVCSLAMVDEADAVDGSEVTVVWGQAGDVSKPGVDPHAPREIRATISTSPLI